MGSAAMGSAAAGGHGREPGSPGIRVAPYPVGMSADLPAGTHYAGERDIQILQYVIEPRMVGTNPCPAYVRPPPPP